MKVKSYKEFKPIGLVITFEAEHEIIGSEGFVTRFEKCKNQTRSMSLDELCNEIRNELKKHGY